MNDWLAYQRKMRRVAARKAWRAKYLPAVGATLIWLAVAALIAMIGMGMWNARPGLH